MIFILAALGTLAMTLSFRRSVLLIPVWTVLTPKALLLLDTPSLPAFSLYKYLCLVMIGMYLTKNLFKKRQHTPQKPFSRAFYLILISSAASAILNISSSNSGLLTLTSMVIEVIMPVTIYCEYLGRQTPQKLNSLMSKYIICYCALAVYGTLCYLINYNPYIEFINSTTHTGRIIAQTYAETLRGIRAQGTISHPITYGALIVMMLLTYYTVKLKKAKLSLKDYLKIGLATTIIIGGALFTNSRTPLILFAVPLIILALSQSAAKSLKYTLTFSLIFVTLFSTSELFRDKVLSVANIFDSNLGEDMNGSDLTMRGAQFAASARHFFNSPLVGGGLDATRNIVSSGLDPDLFNTESIVFRLMIDQGTLGLISYAAFFFLLYIKVARNIQRESARRMYLGMVIGYITFTISTGLIDTLQNALFMICALYYIFKFEPNKNHSIKPRPTLLQGDHLGIISPKNHVMAS
ncbi:hypothetical protein [Pseudomonas lini]|uniref:hypothetical protein n=1 Tax=Pseudomonas lini TaxID=163011 RepID=UPI00345E254B